LDSNESCRSRGCGGRGASGKPWRDAKARLALGLPPIKIVRSTIGLSPLLGYKMAEAPGGA
jgi:hypothetical protein